MGLAGVGNAGVSWPYGLRLDWEKLQNNEKINEKLQHTFFRNKKQNLPDVDAFLGSRITDKAAAERARERASRGFRVFFFKVTLMRFQEDALLCAFPLLPPNCADEVIRASRGLKPAITF